MKHELKKVELSAAEVKITLTSEELSPIKSKIVKNIAEKAEVPGFRKGNAPLDKVEVESVLSQGTTITLHTKLRQVEK